MTIPAVLNRTAFSYGAVMYRYCIACQTLVDDHYTAMNSCYARASSLKGLLVAILAQRHAGCLLTPKIYVIQQADRYAVCTFIP